MKARNGFVSNSSGTSFVIFGVFCNKDKWLERLIEHSEEFRKLVDQLIDEQDEEEVKNLETYLEKANFLLEEDIDFLYDIQSEIEDANYYEYEYDDKMYWFGINIDTADSDRYKLKVIQEKIQLAKDIAKKYGFDESEVEMGSVFERN